MSACYLGLFFVDAQTVLLEKRGYHFVIHAPEALHGVGHYIRVITVAARRYPGSVCEGVAEPELPEVSVHFIHDNDEEQWCEWAALFDGFVQCNRSGDPTVDVCAHRDSRSLERLHYENYEVVV